jgi:Rrf2 family protein
MVTGKMFISQASECVMRAMVYMAGFPVDQVVTKREICKTQDITPLFLIKIMQPLISKGLVNSYRGATGGFSLGKPPEKISMWDIITVVQGPILLNKCIIHPGYCPRDETCNVHNVWQKAKIEVERILSEATLDMLSGNDQKITKT